MLLLPLLGTAGAIVVGCIITAEAQRLRAPECAALGWLYAAIVAACCWASWGMAA